MAKQVINQPNLRRPQLEAALIQKEEQVWDHRFQYGRKFNKHNTKGGYNPDVDVQIRGKTKAELGHQMRMMRPSGHLAVQHGLLLLTKFGNATHCARMGILQPQDSVFTGTGPFKILEILAEEQGLRGEHFGH